MTDSNQKRRLGHGPEIYDRVLAPILFLPWAGPMVERAEIGRGGRILDAACGTGIVAREVALRYGATVRVAGVDRSPAMLEVARRRTSERSVRISWLAASLEAVPFASRCFDRVLCQQGLQYCADPVAALDEMRRLLGRGGRLLGSVWRGPDHCPLFGALSAVFEERIAGPGRGLFAAPCALGDRDRLRRLLVRSRLRRVEIEPLALSLRVPSLRRLVEGELDASPAGRLLALMGGGERCSFLQEVERRLQGFADEDGHTLPFEAWVIEARAE